MFEDDKFHHFVDPPELQEETWEDTILTTQEYMHLLNRVAGSEVFPEEIVNTLKRSYRKMAEIASRAEYQRQNCQAAAFALKIVQSNLESIPEEELEPEARRRLRHALTIASSTLESVERG